MAHIVITAIGSAGDVHPFIGIGRALAQRRHRIVLCTHPQFAPLAERHGFAFVPIGTWDEYARAMASPALWNPRTSFRTLWSVVAPSIRPHFDELAALATSDTVLVGSLWAFAARLMQEVHGTPYISVQVSPSTLLSASAPPTHKRMTVPMWLPLPLRAKCMEMIETGIIDRACGPALNDVRQGLGLPPASRILGRWLHSPDGVLCLFPDWFAAAQPDWPRNHFMAGFPLFNDVSPGAFDDELSAFLSSGKRPVVFTPGSTLIDERAYFGAVDEALRRTGARAIVLARNVGDRWHARADVLVRDFVPMRKLLPHCAALVHHGGIGTAALAFEAGVAQVVTPFAHDQFDNAQRVAQSGCGIRIDSPASGKALASALSRIATDPWVAARCTIARQRIGTAPDACEAAAQYIERLAERRAAAGTRPADRKTLGTARSI